MSVDSTSSFFEIQQVFDEALKLFSAKNADYGDAWRDRGWMGNLSRVAEKVSRLQRTLWHDGPVGFTVAEEDARQTALDAINTLAFFIVNWNQGRRWGTEEPVQPRLDTQSQPDYEAPPFVPSPSAIVTMNAEQTRQAMAPSPRRRVIEDPQGADPTS